MSYKDQDRGTDDDYAAYFAGMNKSMQQKVALTTAHFPPEGKVADMGSGSGQATFDLAALYSGLEMIGVDINEKSVAIAEKTYAKKNLRFITGDIADPLFPDGSLDGILNSSVLHHVTSFNGHRTEPVLRLLDNQVRELKPGGVLIIRDFVIPRGPTLCDLELPDDDGAADGEPRALSSAALFERFAKTWKSSQAPLVFEALAARTPGHRRYRLPLRAAAELVLRKDYRDHWDTELLEEYTYFTQQEFERELTARGMRIVVSVELFNPWIVEHRYAGKFRLTDTSGAPLPFPPTNYLIVAQKVPAGAGVKLVEIARRPVQAPKFLELQAWASGDRVYELAARPQRTLDVLPWFEHAGRLFVVCKRDFPRPILNAGERDLIGMSGGGYITEPITALVADDQKPKETIARVLAERAGIKEIESVSAPWRYFTSPGGISERVDAYLCRIAPWLSSREVKNYSSFSSSGSVRYLDATQTLRACHVGGMFDARLELNIYRLCRERRRALGPWIGAEIVIGEGAKIVARSAGEAFAVPVRSRFTRVAPRAPEFLNVYEGEFAERDASGKTLASARFEYVTPKHLSHETITLLPLVRRGEKIYAGLELRDLPAAQRFEGTSAILTVPACRVPKRVTDLGVAEAFAAEKLSGEFALTLRRCVGLGGRYAPSAGVTPEVVYPYVADVAAAGAACSLLWVELADALLHLDALRDAHLLTSLLRAAHALSVSVSAPL
ncbi:MAG: methyltransferase domain-containing protein [Deltaproteobacteria bacterium]|nr:methyltransferase domain-containing protein [Deltaproteobacteria bacterium]